MDLEDFKQKLKTGNVTLLSLKRAKSGLGVFK